MEFILSAAFLFNLVMAVLKAFGVWDPLTWEITYWMLVVILFVTYGVGAGNDE